MGEINRVVKAAGGRLFLIDLLRTLVMSHTLVWGLMVLLVLAQRVSGFGLDWFQMVLIAEGVAIVGGIFWAVIRRPDAMSIAREVDDRAELRESLSTAMCLGEAQDPWSRAVVETAQQRAKSVKVREALPMQAPRFWPVPLATALAFAIVWQFFPTLDLSGSLAQKEAEEQAQEELIQVKEDIKVQEKQLEEQLKKAGLSMEDLETQEPEEEMPEGIRKPEDLQKAQLKKLTDLQERIRQARTGDKGEQLDAVKNLMRQLRQPGPGPLDEMSRQLARGNFEQAKEALEELKAELAEGDLSEEQKQQLKKQLENLSKQMEKLSENRQALEQALKEAGLNSEDAKKLSQMSPEQMQQALENMKNLTPEQKQKLNDAAKAAAQACQQCQNMSDAAKQMAEGVGEQGMNENGAQGMEGMSQELSAMEMLQQEMSALDSAMSQAQSQMQSLGECLGGESWAQCEGSGLSDWRSGDSSRFGKGSGGPGKGLGAGPQEEQADYVLKKEKADVTTGEGPIIGHRYTHGTQIKGESKAEFGEVIAESSQAASEALETMQVPREFHDPVKSYFGTLKKKVDTKQGEAPEPAPTETAKDAGG